MQIILVTSLVLLDQLSKWWAVRALAGGETIPLALGFHFSYTTNTGAAFGIFQDNPYALGTLSALVSVGIIIYLVRQRHQLSQLNRVAMALILAGALGNMIDRFYLGYVRDMIDFHVGKFHFPIFNVADSCVVIGAGLLLLVSILEPSPSSSHTSLSEKNQEPAA